MTINDVVEERGYRAICVPNGKVALSVLERELPALMLVDLFMPVMNGAEFLKVVKKNPQPGLHPAGHHDGRQRSDDRHQGRRHRPLQAGRLRRADPPPADVLRGARGVRSMTGGARRLRQRRVGELRGRAPLCWPWPARSAPALAAGATRRWVRRIRFLLVAPVPPRDGAATARRARRDFRSSPRFPRRSARGPASPAIRGRLCGGGAANRLSGQAARPRARVGGRRYSDGQRASAREPTVLIMGGPRAGGRDLARNRAQGFVRRRGRVRRRSRGRRSTPTPTTTARCRRRWPERSASWPLRASLPPTPLTRRSRWSSATRGRWRSSRASGGSGRARPGCCRPTPARPRSATCSRPSARTVTRWPRTARRVRRASCSRTRTWPPRCSTAWPSRRRSGGRSRPTRSTRRS